MNKILLTLIITISLSAPAYCEIFKCSDEDGTVIYQNSPCPEGNESQVISNSYPSKSTSDEINRGYDYERDFQDYKFQEADSRKKSYKNIMEISTGNEINIDDYIVPGKYTAFMFHADWCGVCRKVRPLVQTQAKKIDSLLLREINITNWGTPVAKQYNVISVPYFMIYDPNGNLIDTGSRISNSIYKQMRN